MRKADWLALRAGDCTIPVGRSVGELTPELVELLASTDPELRDGCAYEILATWIDRGYYPPQELRLMADQMLLRMKRGLGGYDGDSVFGRTFAVLILAEITHRDARERFLGPEEVRRIHAAGLEYLNAERDLRDYVPEKGWAHACAHTADLLRVLATHPAMGVAELERMLEAMVDRLVAPADRAFVAREEERLALAAAAAFRRGLLSDEAARRWVSRLMTRAPSRQQFSAGQNLIGCHHLYGFVKSLYIMLEGHPLRPKVGEALRAMAPWW